MDDDDDRENTYICMLNGFDCDSNAQNSPRTGIYRVVCESENMESEWKWNKGNKKQNHIILPYHCTGKQISLCV